MNEQIEQLNKRIRDLEYKLNLFVSIDSYRFQKPKIGFFSTEPVVQFDLDAGASDTTGSSGVTMTTGHRFNGNIGTKYYSVGDIVLGLKQLGLFD